MVNTGPTARGKPRKPWKRHAESSPLTSMRHSWYIPRAPYRPASLRWHRRTFAVRPSTEPFVGQLGFDAEQLVINEWLRNTAADIQEHLDRIEDLGSVPGPLEASIGRGPSWAEALEDAGWIPGDILAVGSSMSGPAARVFLGSRASKIIRHSPVPALLIPNGAATALAVDSVAALHQRT